MYRQLIRPLLFQFDAEKVHYFVMFCLKMWLKLPFAKNVTRNLHQVKHPNLVRKVMGLTFENPVGLAAGFDKNAQWIDELACLGFSFIEVGTLTPKPQEGNPKPRLFRLPKDEAIINRMGFNNLGIEQAIQNLRKRKAKIIIGGNIGKNKNTSNEEAIQDYLYCFERLFNWVDYFVVNVSSPNTPHLRALQEREPLQQLLQALQNKNQTFPNPKPILLKIAPDLTFEQIDEILEIVAQKKLTGVVATNTTTSRENLITSAQRIREIGAGGLSGKPLNQKSTEIIAYIRKKANKDLVIIGVGGIDSAQTAWQKIEAGADLVQIYTGLIYQGSLLPKKINQFLAKKMKDAFCY
ncbi:MAG: quinone-dependent dihydroorotate dehydrogenase [Microscillaceae bacterium]|nr:quinone-dependent dihydroorotate dehydrogenase [Microscillaceae bacterium]MDW8460678.1 quinone-dependent dihydroorotate dehydrogenase [Cytophagales bacterium]